MNCSTVDQSQTLSYCKWWSTETVAVVTGANKGIGLAFVKTFAEQGLTVVLTARDICKGQEAVESLRAQGHKQVEFCRLDVTDPESIAVLAKWLQQRFGGLDILVNNAGVCFSEINGNSVEHAETVINTNFYGPKLLTEALMPLFRRSATVSRIFNISSQLGLQTVSVGLPFSRFGRVISFGSNYTIFQHVKLLIFLDKH